MAAITHVGLDIGSTSVRAVEATRTKDRSLVSNFGIEPLPEGAVVGGVVVDDRAVTTALRHLWTAQGFKTRNVALGVTHQQVVVREVEVSNLPLPELRRSLPFQVRDVLPLPVHDALLDFFPLEDAGAKETVRGLLIAAPKEAVLNTVHAVERAGLYVTQVDLACFAALRAAARLTHETEAVVDIGANATTIVIHTDGTPQIVRTIPRAGAAITALLAQRLGMSAAEAEALKCRAGLVRGEGPEAAEVITEALRPLISEIRSSLQYFSTAHPNEHVGRLALVGGTALLPGLVERLTRQLGVPTFLADPLQNIGGARRGGRHDAGRHDALARFRASAAVSIGLTLGAA